MINKLSYLLIAGILSSCYFFKKKGDVEEPKIGKEPIARVMDNYLYEDDIANLFTTTLEQEDSIHLRKRYINSWVRNQVLLQKAEKNITSLSEIEKKVDKYRYDLILFEYERKYLEQNLDNKVTEEEIDKYYKANQSDFELKQNIVKCEFIRLHKNIPKLNKKIPLFKSSKKKDQLKFKEFVMQFSDSYSYESDMWFDFNEVVNNTPFVNYQNQIQFLKKNKIAQESDSNYVYLIRVVDYKISDQISPIEFVRDRIVDVIINKRKVDLLKKLEEGVYKTAKENNEFEIFN